MELQGLAGSGGGSVQLPARVHLWSMQESSLGQSLLSLQGFGSQQPDSPQTVPEPQLSSVQRAWQPATQRTSSLAQRLAGPTTSCGSTQISSLWQSEVR